MDAPELCFLTSVYNRVTTLESELELWRDLLSKSGTSVEWIIVNNGSTDGTARTLDKVRRSRENFRVLHQLQSSTEVALRRGLQSARGKYIVQLESLDYFCSDGFYNLWAKRGDFLLGIGSRPTADRSEPAARRLRTAVARKVFGSQLSDPSCPLIVFRRDLALGVLRDVPETIFAQQDFLPVLFEDNFPGGVFETTVVFSQKTLGPYQLSRASQKNEGLLSTIANLGRFFFWRRRHSRSARLHPAPLPAAS